jgi:hypothetical protein
VEALGALGGIGILIFLFILFVLGIILPISAYSAQKWAYKCYLELKTLNERFDRDALHPPPAEVRDERECPYCAERILRKACICEHCGRDVEPATNEAPTWRCRCGAENPAALETCPRCHRAPGAIV